MAWATYERLPSTMASRLAMIEQALAVRVKADSVVTPTPGKFRAEGVEITNLETGEVVLAATTATYENTEAGSLVRLTGAELAEEELAHLASKLHEVLEVDWPEKVRVEASDIRWRGEASPSAMALVARERLQLVLDSTEAGGVVTGRKLTIQLGTNGARLEVDRNRQVSPPATCVRVDTLGKSVPASWLIALGAVVADGGEEVTFAGNFEVIHCNVTTSGSAVGTLANLQLSEATGLPIAAVGSIRNLDLSWRDGRVEWATGELAAGHGTMPGVLALKLQELYQNVPQAGSQVEANGTLEFEALHVDFQLNGSSLTLKPSSASGGAACVVGQSAQVLFGTPLCCVPVPYLTTVLANYGSDSATELSAHLPRRLRR